MDTFRVTVSIAYAATPPAPTAEPAKVPVFVPRPDSRFPAEVPPVIQWVSADPPFVPAPFCPNGVCPSPANGVPQWMPSGPVFQPFGGRFRR